MGKLSKRDRLKKYFRVYEEVYKEYSLAVYKLAQNSDVSKKTVTKYLKNMHKRGILVGPSFEMKSTESYKEYVYFLNFEYPQLIFSQLKGVPSVLSHSLAAGDWNIAVTSCKPLDFSQLTGFKDMVYSGVKYQVKTPKIPFTNWKSCFCKVNTIIKDFKPGISSKNRELASALPWDRDEWKLFSTFRKNPRQKKTPVLKKIDIQYDPYTAWVKEVEKYCSVITRFYPQGYDHYIHQWVLFNSRYEDQVEKVFSSFCASPVIVEVGKFLLVKVAVSPQVFRDMICCLLDMETVGMVKCIKSAQMLKQYENGYDLDYVVD